VKPNFSIEKRHISERLLHFAVSYTIKGEKMLKVLLWVILIIFLIGLLVVTGVFKMIF
jgi:hypothetical protein